MTHVGKLYWTPEKLEPMLQKIPLRKVAGRKLIFNNAKFHLNYLFVFS